MSISRAASVRKFLLDSGPPVFPQTGSRFIGMPERPEAVPAEGLLDPLFSPGFPMNNPESRPGLAETKSGIAVAVGCGGEEP